MYEAKFFYKRQDSKCFRFFGPRTKIKDIIESVRKKKIYSVLIDEFIIIEYNFW